jgi:hypothetical protein
MELLAGESSQTLMTLSLALPLELAIGHTKLKQFGEPS